MSKIFRMAREHDTTVASGRKPFVTHGVVFKPTGELIKFNFTDLGSVHLAHASCVEGAILIYEHRGQWCAESISPLINIYVTAGDINGAIIKYKKQLKEIT